MSARPQMLAKSAVLAFAALVGLAALPASAQSAAPAARGDAVRGAALYERRCTSCHALDANRIGPLHRGVVGRRAGSVTTFNYSPALRNSGLIWTEPNLDRWLTGPMRLVPGTRMGLSVPLPADRRDIIAYLRSEAKPAH